MLFPISFEPNGKPNVNALSELTADMIDGVEKPEDVPDDFFPRKVEKAKGILADMQRTVKKVELSGGDADADPITPTEDTTMGDVIITPELQAVIAPWIEQQVQAQLAAALSGTPGGDTGTPAGTGDPAPKDRTQDILAMLGIDKMGDKASEEITAALANHVEQIEQATRVQYMQRLAQITRKNKVAEFCTRVTGGTPEAPRGLPVDANKLGEALLSLPSDKAQFFMDLMQDVVNGKIVEFAELGNSKPSKGTRELPAEYADALRSGDMTIADLSNPIIAPALGDLSQYNLAEFKKEA